MPSQPERPLAADANVLILYTGGTIGMLPSANGYVPEPGFLTATLKAQSRFHDPSGESLLSHTASSQSFINWTTSTSSPAVSRPGSPSPPPAAALPPPAPAPAHTFLVRASIADDDDGSAGEGGEGQREVKEGAEGVRYREKEVEGLVTPPVDRSGRRIRYCVLEYSPLIDSSNVSSKDWIRLATDISLNYGSFDGVLLLHGTDTMSYTASALSFLLEDLGKPVIITGAQIPISQLRNDAYENLLGGLIVAGTYPTLPEVGLFFAGKVFRGNRTIKGSNDSFEAFRSEGSPPWLVKVGIGLEVDWGSVRRCRRVKPFRAHRSMCPDVAILRIFPGISAAFFRAFFGAQAGGRPLRGVVLETFGAGNAPESPEILAELRHATHALGIVVLNVTQCQQGSVSKLYSGGFALARAGVVAGGDMTTECALAKLAYLLSKPLTTDQVKHLLSISLRGEISAPSSAAPPPPAVNDLERLNDLLVQAVDLTGGRELLDLPQRRRRRPAADGGAGTGDEADEVVDGPEEVAAWGRTENASHLLEAAILPQLLFKAVSTPQAPDTLRALLDAYSSPSSASSSGGDAAQPQPADADDPACANVVNALNSVGMGLLHVACVHGSAACVRVLLERGASVHVRDMLGHTPLYYCVRQQHAEVEHLVRAAGGRFAGADLDSRHVRGLDVVEGAHEGPPAVGQDC